MKDVNPFSALCVHKTTKPENACATLDVTFAVTLFRGPRRLAGNVQILKLAGLEFVDPAMDADILPIRPSILDDVGVDDILDLLLDRLPDLV